MTTHNKENELINDNLPHAQRIQESTSDETKIVTIQEADDATKIVTIQEAEEVEQNAILKN